jgi:hypothetical protein
MYLDCKGIDIPPTSSTIPEECEYLLSSSEYHGDYNCSEQISRPPLIDKQVVHNLASAYGHVHGKWLIFRDIAHVGNMWRKIDIACRSGKLDRYARVTTLHHHAKKGSYVISVYTRNMFDRDDVMRIRGVLRNLGVMEKIRYKPDIYTALGLYYGIVPGFSASMYED